MNHWMKTPSTQRGQGYPVNDDEALLCKYLLAQEVALQEFDPLNPLKNMSAITVFLFSILSLVFSLGMLFLAAIAIATFIFGMGAWRVGGIEFSGWLWLALRAAVLLVLFCYIVVKPIYAIYIHKKTKRTYLRMIDNQDKDIREFARFAIQYQFSVTKGTIAASLISAGIAFILHDPMMMALGNPWADIITIAVMLIGGKVLLVLLFFPSGRFRLAKENRLMCMAIDQ